MFKITGTKNGRAVSVTYRTQREANIAIMMNRTTGWTITHVEEITEREIPNAPIEVPHVQETLDADWFADYSPEEVR